MSCMEAWPVLVLQARPNPPETTWNVVLILGSRVEHSPLMPSSVLEGSGYKTMPTLVPLCMQRYPRSQVVPICQQVGMGLRPPHQNQLQ